jgi:hypothetical protein
MVIFFFSTNNLGWISSIHLKIAISQSGSLKSKKGSLTLKFKLIEAWYCRQNWGMSDPVRHEQTGSEDLQRLEQNSLNIKF